MRPAAHRTPRPGRCTRVDLMVPRRSLTFSSPRSFGRFPGHANVGTDSVPAWRAESIGDHGQDHDQDHLDDQCALPAGAHGHPLPQAPAVSSPVADMITNTPRTAARAGQRQGQPPGRRVPRRASARCPAAEDQRDDGTGHVRLRMRTWRRPFVGADHGHQGGTGETDPEHGPGRAGRGSRPATAAARRPAPPPTVNTQPVGPSPYWTPRSPAGSSASTCRATQSNQPAVPARPAAIQRGGASPCTTSVHEGHCRPPCRYRWRPARRGRSPGSPSALRR